MKSDAKVWLDSASGAPVKLESSGEAVGVKTKAVQTIEYDSTIKIEAPSRLKRRRSRTLPLCAVTARVVNGIVCWSIILRGDALTARDLGLAFRFEVAL